MFISLASPNEQSGSTQYLRILSDIMTLFIAVLIAFMLLVPAANARPAFSYIAVDARTGKVLLGQNIDAPRYPASLTKMMTLYMVFERLKSGKLTKSSRLKVSRHGASRPPSKLGLRAGQTIKVEDAIRALVTKSANDVAATIGENIGGSESNFAVMMTKKARSIGMSRTTFRNASGLPNKTQKTTARDMATLGLRLQRDFPEYFGYFSLTSYTYKGRRYGNHNHLLTRVKGMDGIKTGYTRASGFNLVTSVGRGKKRIVAVVMGGRTSRRRNAYMAKLIKRAYNKKVTTRGSIAMAVGRPSITVARRTVQANIAAKPKIARGKAETKSFVRHKQANITNARTFSTSKTVSSNEALARLDNSDATPQSWHIQVGAFPKKSGAENRLATAMNRAGSTLKGKQAFTIQAMNNGQQIYRARLSGFDRSSAHEACKMLNRKGVSCFALAPRS